MPEQPFRSYPQAYPKARASASRLVQHLVDMQRKGPRSIPATIVDTSFHVSAGYVLATTQRGIVQVFSVPYGSVVPQMRIFVRQIGATSTNQAYIFDGFAPNISALGTAGSVVISSPFVTVAAAMSTPVNSVPAVTALTSSTGYYWHFFVYLPALPTSTVTLFYMVSGTNVLKLTYQSDGNMRFTSQDGHGYITTTPIAPHQPHWIQIQPSTGSSTDFLVDGVATYTGLIGGSDVPTFNGGSNLYTSFFLSNNDGSASCPVGTWISKIGYGASYSGAVIPLPNVVPAQDSDIVNLNISTTQKTLALYLCEDTPGGTTLANSAAGGSASITLTSPPLTLLSNGPY
ncbi:MAG: hypothetical protein ACJ788_22825 [Ktedonobacteraceae bacterium]